MNWIYKIFGIKRTEVADRDNLDIDNKVCLLQQKYMDNLGYGINGKW